MRYYEPKSERLMKSAVVTVDRQDKILLMEEKPKVPKSNWCCPPFYFYTKEDARLVRVGIESGCGVDAPGSFAAWLSTRSEVFAMQMPGKRYDIGNLESYEAVKRDYLGIVNS